MFGEVHREVGLGEEPGLVRIAVDADWAGRAGLAGFLGTRNGTAKIPAAQSALVATTTARASQFI